MCGCGGQATLGVILQELSTLLLRQGDSVALGLLGFFPPGNVGKIEPRAFLVKTG